MQINPAQLIFLGKTKKRYITLNKSIKIFWETLWSLAPMRRRKPTATLYDVIVDTTDLDLVKQFVKGGHEINTKFPGGKAINLAIRHGNLEFVRYFVEHADDMSDVAVTVVAMAIERISESSENGLEEALSILNYLLKQPLHMSVLAEGFVTCAAREQFTAAKIIITSGLDVNYEIQYDYQKFRTLVKHVYEHGFPEFAALLSGETVNEEQFLHQEKKYQQSGSKYRTQLQASPDYERHLLKGGKLLQCYELFTDELAKGEWDDYLLSTRAGRTAIEFCAENNLTRIAEVILDRKPSFSEDEYRQTADTAALFGSLEIFKMLVALNNDIIKSTSRKDSLLSNACRYGQLDVVTYLLELGANPRASDNNGTSMIEITGGIAKKEITEQLCTYAQQFPPQYKSGYAVKGKAKAWETKHREAIDWEILSWK